MNFAQKVEAWTNLNVLKRSHVMDSSDTVERQFGDDIGYLMNSGQTNPTPPVLDTSESEPSLKFTIPSQSSSGASGQWTMRFAPDNSVQFDEGETFGFMWDQKFDRVFIEYPYLNGAGWKQVIIGEADGATCSSSNTSTCASSCTDLEIVVQNTFLREFPQIYNSCGVFQPFEIGPIYGSDFDRQPHQGNPPPAGSYCFNGAQSACIKYSDGFANPGDQVTRWSTWGLQVSLGAKSGGYFQNSNVKLWMSWKGDPENLIFDYTTNLVASGSGTQKYGRAWLLPYHSGKDFNEVHAVSYTWYRNVAVISGAFDPAFLTTDESVGGRRAGLFMF